MIRTEGENANSPSTCPWNEDPFVQEPIGHHRKIVRVRHWKFVSTVKLHLHHYLIISKLERNDNNSASLTKATNDVGICLSLQLGGGLLWLALLMVTQTVTLDSPRFRGLPACNNGGAVQRLELKNGGRRHCGGNTAGMG